MHRRASSRYGATIAPVGHASMQARQVPQWSVAGGSASRGRSVYSSPRKNQEPADRLRRLVCLPIHPRPALRGERFLHDRGAVGEGAVAEGADLGLDMVGEALKTASDHPVIVAAERVAGDIGELRTAQHGPGVGSAAQVVHAHADDSDGPRHQRRRPGAAYAVAGHVPELAVVAGVEPCEQRRLVRGQVGVGDCHLLKAELHPAAPHRRGQRRVINVLAQVSVGHGSGLAWLYENICVHLRIWLS